MIASPLGPSPSSGADIQFHPIAGREQHAVDVRFFGLEPFQGGPGLFGAESQSLAEVDWRAMTMQPTTCNLMASLPARTWAAPDCAVRGGALSRAASA